MSHEDQDELVELRELVVVYEDRIARYEDVIGGLGLQVGQLGGLCRSMVVAVSTADQVAVVQACEQVLRQIDSEFGEYLG